MSEGLIILHANVRTCDHPYQSREVVIGAFCDSHAVNMAILDFRKINPDCMIRETWAEIDKPIPESMKVQK